MAISEALELLPRKVDAAGDPDLDVDEAGFYRPVDLEYYEEVAAASTFRGSSSSASEMAIALSTPYSRAS